MSFFAHFVAAFFPIPNTIAGIFPFCEKLPAICFLTHFNKPPCFFFFQQATVCVSSFSK